MSDEQYAALNAKLDAILARLEKPAFDDMSLAELQQALHALQGRQVSTFADVEPNVQIMLRLMIIQAQLDAMNEQFINHLTKHTLSVPMVQIDGLMNVIEQKIAGRVRNNTSGNASGGVF